MIFFGILVAIIIFSIVVLIHELGHFSAARKFGVKVEEFGLGIPPRAKILFTDKYGTKYSLNWLPLGGFVKLYGETNNSPSPTKERGLGGEVLYKNENLKLINKPAWQQAIIILAGVFMNFLLATIIFSILFFIGIKPLGINTQIPTNLELKLIPTYSQAIDSGLLIKQPGLILSPVENSIAQKSGIKQGDILLKINNIPISTPKQAIEIIKNNPGNTLIFTIKRKENIINLNITPDKNNGKIGAYIGDNIKINKDFKYKYGILDSIKHGFTETYNQSLLTIKGIGLLLKKIISPEKPQERQEALNQMSGPIGIVDFISNSLSNGFIFLLIITAIISINLGVFNLLPIPALDGGRFIFIIINGVLIKIFGKKIISTNTENLIHIMFFITLIALSILIGYNDINKIINR